MIRTSATIIFILSLCSCAQQIQYSATKLGATEADRQQDMGACKVTMAGLPIDYEQNHGLIPILAENAQNRQNDFLADCMRSKGWTVTAQQQATQ